jgi:hypothetical protein
VRFEVLTAVKMLMLFFWVVTPCGLVGRYQLFEEICCLHLETSTQNNNNDKIKPIFGHGQLYVSLSRERSHEGVKIHTTGAKIKLTM